MGAILVNAVTLQIEKPDFPVLYNSRLRFVNLKVAGHVSIARASGEYSTVVARNRDIALAYRPNDTRSLGYLEILLPP